MKAHSSSPTPESSIITLLCFGPITFALTAWAFAFTLHKGSITSFPPSDNRVAYIAGPDTRGTTSLIWSCISTIFTCVYISIHVDVPNPSRLEILKERLVGQGVHPQFLINAIFTIWKWATKPICRRVLWMSFNIYAPELVVLVALLERISATYGRRVMKELKVEGWTMTHAFFADMGGFEVEYEGKAVVVPTNLELSYWLRSDEASRQQLDAAYLKTLKEEIEDHSKRNALLKAYTCLQAVWVVVETVFRKIENRPVSELEVATCAYVFCTLFIYCFWWSKPYDVGRRIMLRPRPSCWPPIEDQQLSGGKLFGPHIDAALLGGVFPLSPMHRYSRVAGDPQRPRDCYPRVSDDPRPTPFNRASSKPSRDWLCAVFFSGIIGVAMGGIHCIVWDARFINTMGQWMWRSSCITQIALPILFAAFSLVENWHIGGPLYIPMLLIAFLYCVTRTLFFALIGLSFWSLPAGVYTEVKWSVPHWH